ncbi:preprotein translocase subunit YajC [Haloferula rosea]|uniref:Sec translocon accessory complex subunit YajC n=1 Tax=Haloferula rosea TaxID=490093 RepID=A0A934RE19_9BACT|nr:preprotein translocase subunit YajC [Haloferula rosea]MBK1828820.1 preprotein translocase subunit YajC [Haloferula rosea]
MTDMISPSTFLLAQAENAAQSTGGGGLLGNPLVMMGLMIVMFYFLLIRPQQRQRKELQQRIDSLKNGDRVITTAGIHAIVHNIKDKTVTLKIADGTMVEFDKQAVASVHKKESKGGSKPKSTKADPADMTEAPKGE